MESGTWIVLFAIAFIAVLWFVENSKSRGETVGERMEQEEKEKERKKEKKLKERSEIEEAKEYNIYFLKNEFVIRKHEEYRRERQEYLRGLKKEELKQYEEEETIRKDQI